MSFEEYERHLKKQLQSRYDAGEAAAIANRLLETYTSHNRLQRRLQPQQAISEKALWQLQAATSELLQGNPLQYILGYADFCGLEFRVNESVLIPRPETEELADWMIKDYQHKKLPLRILDIGTGSGCIPITLKIHLPDAEVFSLDISEKAIALAIQNAGLHQAAVRFLQLDFLEESNWPQLEQYDVIISNPPYIPQQEKTAMERQVADREPAMALFVPDEKPLLFYEKIAAFSKNHLSANGTIYLEAHKDYAAAVRHLFVQQGYAAELRKDLHGNNRMVKVVNRQS